MSAVKTRPFDVAESLGSDDAITAYMIEALETGDPNFVVGALRTRGETSASTACASHFCVMAGLGPATHDCLCRELQSLG